MALALVLAATASGPDRISLHDLVLAVRSAAADAGLSFSAGTADRRALVTVLRWLVARGVVRELDRAVASYGADDGVDALLEIRNDRLTMLAAPPLVGADSARELQDRREGRERTAQRCAVTRALIERDGPGTERQAWERAGMPLDLVSAPVLTWGLPLLGDSPVAVAARAMTAAGLPLHLSAAAVRRAPPRVAPGTAVLVVENPRLVEAAAERNIPAGMLCTNGNATTASPEAVRALHRAGARLRYHGDFDCPGLAMAARMAGLGCVPFRMTAADYLAALASAAADGVALPRDRSGAPDTGWDPGLAAAFTAHRLAVHEERVMDEVLDAHAATG